ncbi:hypothetical protein RZS08_00265, partial [Arthrospira platensis SPKY1]|nr:hypothetical protein [Arthrospira platensis SPKY1]
MREAFDQTIAYLRPAYPYLYEMFWSGLQPISYASGVLVIAAPDERRREMCAVRHAGLIGRTLRLVTGRNVQVQFV